MVFNVDREVDPSEHRSAAGCARAGKDERCCLRCHWRVPDYVPAGLTIYALSDHRANDCATIGSSIIDAPEMSNVRRAGHHEVFRAGGETVAWRDT